METAANKAVVNVLLSEVCSLITISSHLVGLVWIPVQRTHGDASWCHNTMLSLQDVGIDTVCSLPAGGRHYMGQMKEPQFTRLLCLKMNSSLSQAPGVCKGSVSLSKYTYCSFVAFMSLPWNQVTDVWAPDPLVASNSLLEETARQRVKRCSCSLLVSSSWAQVSEVWEHSRKSNL